MHEVYFLHREFDGREHFATLLPGGANVVAFALPGHAVAAAPLAVVPVAGSEGPGADEMASPDRVVVEVGIGVDSADEDGQAQQRGEVSSHDDA